MMLVTPLAAQVVFIGLHFYTSSMTRHIRVAFFFAANMAQRTQQSLGVVIEYGVLIFYTFKLAILLLLFFTVKKRSKVISGKDESTLPLRHEGRRSCLPKSSRQRTQQIG